MSKSATASVNRNSGHQLPTKSAWSKGPPQTSTASSSSNAPSPRSQSPAPHHHAPSMQHSHSRRPSALGGGVSIKDGVSVPRGNLGAAKQSSGAINFGSVNDQNASLSTSPPSTSEGPPTIKTESRTVQSFGSIANTPTTATAPPLTINGKPPPSNCSSVTISTPTTTSTPTTSTKPLMDVKSLFRGNASMMSSPVQSSFGDSVASPSTRNSALPSQAHGVHQGMPIPNQHPQPVQPSAMYGGYMSPHPGLRPPSAMGNAPRSPSFSRAVPNGSAGGVRPTGPTPPTPGPTSMPSPRMGPPQHLHQHPPPGQPMGGMQPQWPPYYYPQYIPGMPPEQHYAAVGYPPPWMAHPPPAQHGIPVSPRNPHPPLQPPATPPTTVIPPPQTSTARLNSGASAFVPSHNQSQRQSKVTIKDASGHEIDFQSMKKSGSAVPSPVGVTAPSPSPVLSEKRRSVIRMESEEVHKRRIAEEEERKRKEEDDRRRREEGEKRRKEEDERKQLRLEEQRKRAEEEKRKEEEKRLREEQERKKKEEEERLRLEEEERIKEVERKRKEEEERLRLEEEQRQREEEERIRREEEQRREEEERLKQEKQEEEERQRKELELEQQRQKEKEKEEEEEKERLRIEEENKAKELAEKDAVVAPLPEHPKRRPIPGPLDITTANRPGLPPSMLSAVATARVIQDLGEISYPEGVKSPRPDLNTNAKDGKFRYDRDFLLQFMTVCKEKPDNLPDLEAIGLEPADQSHSMGRGGSGRRGASGSMGPPTSRQGIGLGIMPGSAFGKASPSGSMGQFSTPGKLTSEERFLRSSSVGSAVGALAFGARQTPMVRTASQGGPNGSGAMGNKRTRSQRGNRRDDSNRVGSIPSNSSSNYNNMSQMSFEPVAPLEVSANRWVAGTTSRRPQAVDMDSPEMVDRKVRGLLNKLTLEKFDSISDQIITWANKSENEKDGRTLIQVIRLVFEKATDEATWSEMYAKLCRKMMEQISPNVQDDGIRSADGNAIAGGQLFRKYLLNRCQEDFERGWKAKEVAAAAAANKASEDDAVKAANESNADSTKPGEEALYSEEYYIAQKAKRQGLGLVKFIGELFKLQMLTERIMHQCIKKLLSNVENPEEEEIESLCKLLSTVGQALDTAKAKGHMDVYFQRMKDLAKSSNVTSRMQYMLLDVIELRDRKWSSRNASQAPTTLAQVHEAAAKEKAQQEKDALSRTMNMSRGGSRRGMDRADQQAQPGPDGWQSVSQRGPPPNKVGDLSQFGKINKPSAGVMNFGPSSVFVNKREGGIGGAKGVLGGVRESALGGSSLSRTSSSSNMFSMLSQGSEPDHVPSTLSAGGSKGSRPPSRKPSVDLGASGEMPVVPGSVRRTLALLPRTLPVTSESKSDGLQPPATGAATSSTATASTTASTAASASASGSVSEEEGDGEDEKPVPSSMTEAEADKQVSEDIKEFFGVRNISEAEDYLLKLPPAHHPLLIERLVSSALESKEADAKLVSQYFAHIVSQNKKKTMCSPESFEKAFASLGGILDDVVIDAPKALDYFALMLNAASSGDGAGMDKETVKRIAGQSEQSEKILTLLNA